MTSISIWSPGSWAQRALDPRPATRDPRNAVAAVCCGCGLGSGAEDRCIDPNLRAVVMMGEGESSNGDDVGNMVE